jgi:hypothetical protein
MNKIFKPKLSLSLVAMLAALVIFSGNLKANAQVPNVIFQNSPLFSEVNFLPGQEVGRFVQVRNTADTARTAAANILGGQLELTIKQGATVIYAKTLTDFSNDSAADNGIILSTINPGETVQYDFNIIFKPTAGNAYMFKSLTFDILVGFTDGPAPQGFSVNGFSGGLSSFSAITAGPAEVSADEQPDEPANIGIIPRVLGLKLADTGFSNAEFAYIILSLLVLFGIRALLKKSAD